MLDYSGLLRFLRRPVFWFASGWRHDWRWALQGSVFERRHYRRLAPLVVMLGLLTVVWSFFVLGVGLLLGGVALIAQEAFLQSVLANLLVLPLGLAIAVVVGTVIQKHSLRFQARHAADRLGDSVRLTTFKFILYLQRACGLPIDIGGPTDYRFVNRANTVAHQVFLASSWNYNLPADFDLTLDNVVTDFVSCFHSASDLRFAFPRAFDLADSLQSAIRGIRADPRQSPQSNTALIVLNHASEIIRDLE